MAAAGRAGGAAGSKWDGKEALEEETKTRLTEKKAVGILG